MPFCIFINSSFFIFLFVVFYTLTTKKCLHIAFCVLETSFPIYQLLTPKKMFPSNKKIFALSKLVIGFFFTKESYHIVQVVNLILSFENNFIFRKWMQNRKTYIFFTYLFQKCFSFAAVIGIIKTAAWNVKSMLER